MQFRSKELEEEFRTKEAYIATLREAVTAGKEKIAFLERDLYGLATGELLAGPSDFKKVFDNMARWYKW